MNLLLDTHIWIWSLLEPARLSRRTLRALKSTRSVLWLSPISTWEFLILVKKARVLLDVDPETWLARAAEAMPTREASLTHEIARESRRVGLPHHDPADRFLVATAKVLKLTLVTADERLAACRDVTVLRNVSGAV